MSTLATIAYKGLNQDLTTHNGFRYELHRDYIMDNSKLCISGYHACLDPLDCFYFYNDSSSRYFLVEGEYDSSNINREGISKLSFNNIYLDRELTLPELCNISYRDFPEKWKFGFRIIKQNNGYIMVNSSGVNVLGGIYEQVQIIDNNVCFIYIDGKNCSFGCAEFSNYFMVKKY